MKNKLTAIALTLTLTITLILCLAACTGRDSSDGSESMQNSVSVTVTETGLEAAATTVSEKSTASNDEGGGTIELDKYRVCYYSVPAPFVALVGEFVYTEYAEVYEVDNPSISNVMVMKKFIQHFNISREDFDKANAEWAKIVVEGLDGVPMMNPQDFANQEDVEVYNADIIYTFDDEIINAYYLSHDYPFVYELDYEKAVAAGTYQTRTAPEDFFYPNTRAEDRLAVTTAAE